MIRLIDKCDIRPVVMDFDQEKYSTLAIYCGDVCIANSVVDSFLDQHSADNSAMQPLSTDEVRIIEFHLDAPGFPAWRAFCQLTDGVGIVLRATGCLKVAAKE